ncbi:methylamine dehydrogenase accessory protein MauD [Roseateles koreensis]|uniref:Methylamine utilization protein MauD n=1 Tax=Roseateles koreensis TaxID=2987526 RepID=A0ABT5KVI4_9BURK|nr:methylamine dehydrogenase accessory protein MauD [Roseateles koreensis]MDC8786383.1 methylamine dehydrogenase accessory protein MauD [Roseateles koreensis]
MNDALIISNIVLWVAVLALLLVVLALSRQIGILYERIAPMGALMMDSGPKVGDAAPRFELPTLGGTTLALGGADAQHSHTLLFFLSPTCPVCKKLLPILKSVRKAEGAGLQIVLASDGDRPEHDEFRHRAGLTDFPYVLSTELGMKYQISKLPYAVLIDGSGRISAKGLVNSREQLDSLFAARELGVASVQDYLDVAGSQAGHKHALSKEHA